MSVPYVPIPAGGGEDAVLETVLANVGKDCTSLLDVGCYEGKYLARIAARRPALDLWALDAHAPSLAKVPLHPSRKMLGVLPGALLPCRSGVDAVICLDVLEHLDAADVDATLGLLRMHADVVAVVFTPLGYVPQDGEEHADPDLVSLMRHRCGVTPEQLERVGFSTFAWRGFDYGGGLVHDALWGVYRR